ncbi:leucine-rich PPR motif-containing protein, mitochondrial isoform X1 [Neodiprion virginianus]|uniref:leucine-rich PPR motif-containing protein, mitochondrial isoform X1 n=1 Tax=Neodiprion virginianus TaxID=2961670 RepID=UPI001EE6F3FA|nr:leucine-rich PPR motif-containing protein, mitochondrial isoform X1 [Neodiprion virginianus]
MATILRSSKYFRNFAELTTKLSFSHVKYNACVTLLSQRHCIAPSTLVKSLATQVAVKQVEGDSALELSLRKAEADVRKYGQIRGTKLDQIFKIFQSSKSVSSTQALMLLRCCGNLVASELPEHKSEIANRIWESLKNSGTELEVSHFNALLRVYIENEYAFSPAEVLAEMDKAGIEPNKLTYQRLITRYCQQGDIEGASTILEFMKEKNLSVNENIFTALIRGHSEAGDMTSAAEILSIMRTAGSEPSADTYKELLCGYAKHGDMESITRTISECRSNNIDLLDADFLDVINSLACGGHTQHVEAILSIMPKEVGYLHDALNHILKLVHSGQAEAAMQVLRSIPNVDKGQVGSPLLKNLVKADLPAVQLIDMCNEIANKGINSRALYIGLESKLLQGDVEGSLAFLNTLRDSGEEIRPHYFWPLFIALKFSNKDILDLVETIQQEFSLVITPDTLRDYIIPCMNGTPDEIFSELILTGAASGTIAYAIVYHLIVDMRLKEAADFCTKHEFSYNVQSLCRPLVKALKETGDTESFVTILGNMCERTMKTMEDDDKKKMVCNDVIELYLSEIALLIKKDKSNLQAQIYSELSKAGLDIGNTGAFPLSQRLASQMPPKMNSFMSRNKSGNYNIRSEIQNLEQEIYTSSKNAEASSAKKQRLLLLYSRSGDIANLEKLVEELKEDGIQFTESMYKTLVNAYCNVEMLDKAEQYISALNASYPTYVLDANTTIKYISLLVKANRINDAVQYVKNMPNIDAKKDSGPKKIWWKILKSVAELGNVEAVNAIFNTLVQKEYIGLTAPYLGMLIKVHVCRDDLKEALKMFEKICETYRVTPYKSELAKKFILAEDATSLQRMTDLSTQIHGEPNSLYDLALNFIECDCLRQAKRILEIPALFPNIRKLKLHSERWREYGATSSLEKLISVLKDIPHLKAVPEFYDDLICCYNNENAWEEAFKFWQEMIEQEIEPSDRFLAILADLLKRNNQPVPFEVPVLQNFEKFPTTQNAKRQSVNSISDESTHSNSEMNTTTNNRPKRMTGVKESSELIQSLLDQGKLDEAVEITYGMIEGNKYPLSRVFYSLMKAMIETGNEHLLKQIEEKMSRSMKVRVRFQNNLCRAYAELGKLDKLLDSLEASAETIVQSAGERSSHRYPQVLAKYVLKDNSQLLERYINLTGKYAAHGFVDPVEMLWVELFTNGQPEAHRIWSQYLSNKPDLPFTLVAKNIEAMKNSTILEKIVKISDKNPHISQNIKGLMYASLISAYCREHKYQESIAVLQKAMETIPLEFIEPTVLNNLDSHVKAQGLNLPAGVSESIAEAVKNAAEKQPTT